MAKVIGKIESKTGETLAEVLEFEVNGKTLHRWNGKWGAGCGNLADILTNIRRECDSRRGWIETVALPA